MGLSRLSSTICSCFILAAVCPMMGCGGAGHGEVPVSGQVTYDGEPVAGLQITFQPIAKDASGFGPGSFGRTDAQGRFSMRTVWPDAPGAIPGKHRVQLSFERGPPERARLIPKEYRDGTAVYEVPPAGTDQAHIELTSNK